MANIIALYNTGLYEIRSCTLKNPLAIQIAYILAASAVSFSLARIAQSLTLGLAKLTGAFQVTLNGSS